MATLQERIEQIKEKNNQAIINKAKAEERLKHLEEQKAEIEAQCKALKINPKQLAKKIEEETKAIEALTLEAEILLGLSDEVVM